MVDIVGTTLGYEHDIFANQMLHQGVQERAALSPLLIEEVQTKVAAEQEALSRSRQTSQILSQAQMAPTMEVMAPDSADRLLNQSNQMLDLGGKLIRSGDAKTGGDFITEGRQLQMLALEKQKTQYTQQKNELAQTYQWASTINSQESLDNVKSLVEAAHPNMWRQLRLPDTYTPQSAQVFKTIADASLDAKDRMELNIKMIEAKTAPRYFEAKTQAEEARVVHERMATEIARENLKRMKDDTTTQAKFDAEIAKENIRYNNELAKQEAAILKDTKKFSPEVPKATLVQRMLVGVGATDPVDEVSPRDAALKNVRQAADAAHDRNIQAIMTKYSGRGVVSPTATKMNITGRMPLSGVPGKTTDQVMNDLRTFNPGVADDELISYGKSKGYLK